MPGVGCRGRNSCPSDRPRKSLKGFETSMSGCALGPAVAILVDAAGAGVAVYRGVWISELLNVRIRPFSKRAYLTPTCCSSGDALARQNVELLTKRRMLRCFSGMTAATKTALRRKTPEYAQSATPLSAHVGHKPAICLHEKKRSGRHER